MDESSNGNTEQTKRCMTCCEVKKADLFNKNRSRKDGLHDQCKACRRAYRVSNPEILYDNASSRRANKKKNTPRFIRDCPVDKQRRVFAYNLSRLLTETTGIQHHVDHMWPISDGGPHWSGNLQVIPAVDNLSKHATVDEEIKKTIKEGLEYARRESKG